MASFFRSCRVAAGAALLAAAVGPAAADVLDLQFDRSLPILLDADSSEFDRKNDRLEFTGLRISQGAIGLRADTAQASRLDFEDSLWTFTGNVVIENASTRAWCENAEVRFDGHQLRNAVLRGSPARFEQFRPEAEAPTRGRARTMEYDLQAGIIRMLEDAWVSDGANEVSGGRIAYDVGRQFIIADGEDGPVRMKINPPEQGEGVIP